MWLNRDSLVTDRTCIELGAGLGLVGLLACQLGARLTVITDGDDDTLQRLCSNMERNGFAAVRRGEGEVEGEGADEGEEGGEVGGGGEQPAQPHAVEAVSTMCRHFTTATDGGGGGGSDGGADATARATVARLWWADEGETKRVLDLLPSGGTGGANGPGSLDGGGGGYDVVLAADVVYEEHSIVPLVQSAAELLKRTPDARWILSFARRNIPIDAVLAEAR